MNETDFHLLADRTLARILERVEAADARGDIDIELQDGVLSITLPSGRGYVLNKHAPTRQIWLSSPISGGLHFNREGDRWVARDGRELEALLEEELHRSATLVLR